MKDNSIADEHRYEHPKITRQECESVIESYKRMKWWP